VITSRARPRLGARWRGLSREQTPLNLLPKPKSKKGAARGGGRTAKKMIEESLKEQRPAEAEGGLSDLLASDSGIPWEALDPKPHVFYHDDEMRRRDAGLLDLLLLAK
jgi:hypothetical protein